MLTALIHKLSFEVVRGRYHLDLTRNNRLVFRTVKGPNHIFSLAEGTVDNKATLATHSYNNCFCAEAYGIWTALEDVKTGDFCYTHPCESDDEPFLFLAKEDCKGIANPSFRYLSLAESSQGLMGTQVLTCDPVLQKPGLYVINSDHDMVRDELITPILQVFGKGSKCTRLMAFLGAFRNFVVTKDHAGNKGIPENLVQRLMENPGLDDDDWCFHFTPAQEDLLLQLMDTSSESLLRFTKSVCSLILKKTVDFKSYTALDHMMAGMLPIEPAGYGIIDDLLETVKGLE